ncbi:MAG: HAMP domain-containing sensor histidine kinase [Bacteroidia bacterium]|nr:HAMP domain-containing sensor histidine kinase [Bacteroidia bacterium]
MKFWTGFSWWIWTAAGISTWVVVAAGIYAIFWFRLEKTFQKILLQLKKRQVHDAEFSRDRVVAVGQAMVVLAETIRKEFHELRETELFRKEYVGAVSHELKTPIFAIEGFLETLMDGALDDPQVNRLFLQKALDNVRRLNNLVRDLLVISQLESGQIEMRIEPFNLYELALDVLENISFKLTENGRNVKASVQGCENVQVMGDRERIGQVLDNLVSNAVVYGKADGTVRITLKQENDKKIRLSVADDGPGIAAEHLPKIFDRFYRVEKSRSRAAGGTGLGLSIVKNILERHNTSIAVESELGKGSTFSFSLPMAD